MTTLISYFNRVRYVSTEMTPSNSLLTIIFTRLQRGHKPIQKQYMII